MTALTLPKPGDRARLPEATGLVIMPMGCSLDGEPAYTLWSVHEARAVGIVITDYVDCVEPDGAAVAPGRDGAVVVAVPVVSAMRERLTTSWLALVAAMLAAWGLG